MFAFEHLELNIISIVCSIPLLWISADAFVDSASAIARRLGLSELVLGLTVVALGTSAPEFAVSISAARLGHTDIALGNVVGSNIFNLGFILGICILIAPIRTSPSLFRRDCTMLIFSLAFLTAFAFDGIITGYEGVILLIALVAYSNLLMHHAKHEPTPENSAPVTDSSGPHRPILIGIIALTGILIGARLLVDNGVAAAQSAGVSDWLISVTIIALGTSLPELVTSLVAATKGHHEMSAGALVGSDIYNTLGVLGVTACITSIPVTSQSLVSIGMSLAMVVLVTLFTRTGWQLTRPEGLCLIGFGCARWLNLLGATGKA